MAIYHQDIAEIELNSGSLHRSFLGHSIGMGDAAANRFGVRVFRDGVAETLSGVTCQGFFRNANGQNIALTSYGTISGNVAYVTLPQACYNVEGRFTLAIKLVGGGVTGTMRIVDGMVDNTNTGSAVAPTGSVPTYQEVLSVYEQMQAAVTNYNAKVAEQDGKISDLKSAINGQAKTYSYSQCITLFETLLRGKVCDLRSCIIGETEYDDITQQGAVSAFELKIPLDGIKTIQFPNSGWYSPLFGNVLFDKNDKVLGVFPFADSTIQNITLEVPPEASWLLFSITEDMIYGDQNWDVQITYYSLENARSDILSLKEITNAKSPKDYGAIGDGVSDDTIPIRLCIENNDNVIFTDGTYKVSFDGSDNQILFPLHSNQTVKFTRNAKMFVTGDLTGDLQCVFGFDTFPCDNVLIDGANIYCSSAEVSNPAGIKFETEEDANADQITNVIISNCTFNSLGSAVYILQRSTEGTEDRQCRGVIVQNCTAYKCLGSFVTADGKDIKIDNCTADGGSDNNSYDAVSIHSGQNIKVTNNTFINYKIGQVVNVRNSPENLCGSKNVIISNNYIYNCPTKGIQISIQSGESEYGVSNIKISGNIIETCDIGIMITPGSGTSGILKEINITGNVIKKCAYTFRIASHTGNFIPSLSIVGNTFIGGSFAIQCIKNSIFNSNIVHVGDNSSFNVNYMNYSSFCENYITSDYGNIYFNYCNPLVMIGNNIEKATYITNEGTGLMFSNNNCSALSIGGYQLNTATEVMLSRILGLGAKPTATQAPYGIGSFVRASSPTTDFGWILTSEGWKAIKLADE